MLKAKCLVLKGWEDGQRAETLAPRGHAGGHVTTCLGRASLLRGWGMLSDQVSQLEKHRPFFLPFGGFDSHQGAGLERAGARPTLPRGGTQDVPQKWAWQQRGNVGEALVSFLRRVSAFPSEIDRKSVV